MATTFLRKLAPLLVALACAGSETTSSNNIATYASSTLSVDFILRHMAEARAASRGRLRAYRITRSYRLFGTESPGQKSEAMAAVRFTPPDSEQFVVKHSSGSRWTEQGVRQMPEHETEIARHFMDDETGVAKPPGELNSVWTIRWLGQSSTMRTRP